MDRDQSTGRFITGNRAAQKRTCGYCFKKISIKVHKKRRFCGIRCKGRYELIIMRYLLPQNNGGRSRKIGKSIITITKS